MRRSLSKKVFDKLVDGGVSPPPLPPPQRTETVALARRFRQRDAGNRRFRVGWSCLPKAVARLLFRFCLNPLDSGRKICKEAIFLWQSRL